MAISKINKTAYKWFGKYSKKRVNETLKKNLDSAHIEVRADVYVSTAFLCALIGLIVGIVAYVIILFVLLPAMGFQPDIFGSLILLLLFLMISPLTYLIYTKIPSMIASSRKKKIDNDLAYALNFVSAMSSAGVTPNEIFRSLSKQDIYGEIKEEAAWIYRDVEVLGLDIITAIKNNIKRTPSEKFGEFLQGMIVTISSGGSLKAYFMSKANQFMIENRQNQRQTIESLGIMAESYVTAAVAGILLLFIVIPVMMIISGDASQLNFLYVLIFMVVPLIHLGFAYIIKSMSVGV